MEGSIILLLIIMIIQIPAIGLGAYLDRELPIIRWQYLFGVIIGMVFKTYF